VLRLPSGTTKSTDCAYSRAVVAGDKMRANVELGQVVNYKQALNLNQEDTEMVSDHYPIELVIK